MINPTQKNGFIKAKTAFAEGGNMVSRAFGLDF
jgi:hypothetical protein